MTRRRSIVNVRAAIKKFAGEEPSAPAKAKPKKSKAWCRGKDQQGRFCLYRARHRGDHGFGCAAGSDGDCYHPKCPQENPATRKSWCERASAEPEED